MIFFILKKGQIKIILETSEQSFFFCHLIKSSLNQNNSPQQYLKHYKKLNVSSY